MLQLFKISKLVSCHHPNDPFASRQVASKTQKNSVSAEACHECEPSGLTGLHRGQDRLEFLALPLFMKLQESRYAKEFVLEDRCCELDETVCMASPNRQVRNSKDPPWDVAVCWRWAIWTACHALLLKILFEPTEHHGYSP